MEDKNSNFIISMTISGVIIHFLSLYGINLNEKYLSVVAALIGAITNTLLNLISNSKYTFLTNLAMGIVSGFGSYGIRDAIIGINKK
jgi:lantibiotic modifying enzyme